MADDGVEPIADIEGSVRPLLDVDRPKIFVLRGDERILPNDFVAGTARFQSEAADGIGFVVADHVIALHGLRKAWARDDIDTAISSGSSDRRKPQAVGAGNQSWSIT